MAPLFASWLGDFVSLETILSVFSFGVTVYFWFVQARKEKPNLTFHQLNGFRASLRNSGKSGEGKRLWLSQVGPGGVLVANHSTRQNAILRFDCFLELGGQRFSGSWGYVGEDAPPWNIAPESALALSLCCTFEVPDAMVLPDDFSFRLEFLTVSGTRFPHLFSLKAPHEERDREPLAA